jgi:hypothetical protein
MAHLGAKYFSKKSVRKRQNKFSVGTSLKLFPGSYTKVRINFKEKNIVVGEAYLNDTKANLNIAYSGNLNNGFTDFEVIQNRSLEN